MIEVHSTMLYLVLLSVITAVKGTGHLSFYPLIIPISTASGHHQHTTHVIPHPLIRTHVLVLGDEDHQHHHQHNQEPNYLDHHEHSHHQTHKYNHHLNHKSSHLNVQPQIQQQNNQRKENLHQKSRTRDPSHNIKYSVPVEESSWKPIRGIPTDYLPFKYLGDDENKVSNSVHKAMRQSDYDSEEKSVLILPIGIKKLHNPQLRPPPRNYWSSTYRDAKTKVRHANEPVIYKVRSGKKHTWLGHHSFDNIRCHCSIHNAKPI